MKKLELDALAVDTFATSAEPTGVRGTVIGQELAGRTLSACPDSWNGTCYITCGADCTQAACA